MPETTAISVSQTTTEQAWMRAAYYAAFHDLGGDADTVATWVGQALQAHAARSKPERRDRHAPFARDPGDPTAPRRYVIPTAAVTAMRAALAVDRSHTDGPPVVLTESAWARDAITAAVTDVTTALADRGITLHPMDGPLPRGRLRR